MSAIQHCLALKPFCEKQLVLAEQEAKDHISIVQRFVKEVFGKDLNVQFTVQWGKPNAWWDGKKITFNIANFLGDDGQPARFTRDFDIVAHEIGHIMERVLRGTKRLPPYTGKSGAIRESVADSFAMWAKERAIRQGYLPPCSDKEFWLIGDTVVKDKVVCNGKVCHVYKQALRSFTNPGTAFEKHPVLGSDRQKLQYQYLPLEEDNGGVHHEAGILNRIIYEICETTGTNPRSQLGTVVPLVLKIYGLLDAPYTFGRLGKTMVNYLRGNYALTLGERTLVQKVAIIEDIWNKQLKHALGAVPTSRKPSIARARTTGGKISRQPVRKTSAQAQAKRSTTPKTAHTCPASRTKKPPKRKTQTGRRSATRAKIPVRTTTSTRR